MKQRHEFDGSVTAVAFIGSQMQYRGRDDPRSQPDSSGISTGAIMKDLDVGGGWS